MVTKHFTLLMPTLFLLISQSNFTIRHQQYIEYSTTKLLTIFINSVYVY